MVMVVTMPSIKHQLIRMKKLLPCQVAPLLACEPAIASRTKQQGLYSVLWHNLTMQRTAAISSDCAFAGR